jgi:hypothetical protein
MWFNDMGLNVIPAAPTANDSEMVPLLNILSKWSSVIASVKLLEDAYRAEKNVDVRGKTSAC